MTQPLTNLPGPSPQDDRDYLYIPSSLSSPSSGDLRPFVYEIEDQSTIGSCACNAIPSACELFMDRAKQPMDLSRLFLYYNTRNAENRLSQEGIFIRDGLDSARHQGLPLETLWPYDISKENTPPPAEVYPEALKTTLRRYERICSSFDPLIERQTRIDLIKAAITEGLPVVIGMVVGKAIFTLTGPWQSHNYPSVNAPGNESVGGHSMLIVGYDDAAGMFIVQNSWGSGWGDKGFWGMGYSHVMDSWFEAWVIRGFADAQVKEPPGIKFELVNKFRLEARIVPTDDEVGKTAKLWVGAVLNGQLFLKTSDSDTSWAPYDGINYTPANTGYLLTPSNFVHVVTMMDLAPFSGADVYLGYGNDPFTWKVQKLCTIPAF